MLVRRSQSQKRILAACKNLSAWDMGNLMLLSKLIKKKLLLVKDEACKLKEPIIRDETEAEIEIELLNLLNSENEVHTISDTQAMVTPQLLYSPHTHTSSRQYQQPETTSFLYTKINWNSCRSGK